MMGVIFIVVVFMIVIGVNFDLGIIGIFGVIIVLGLIGIVCVLFMGKLFCFFLFVVIGLVFLVIGFSLMKVGIEWVVGGELRLLDGSFNFDFGKFIYFVISFF